MKKVLAIIGSPRRLGNCEIMAKEISRQITEPHTLKLLRLSDFNILPCRGCYLCLSKEKTCAIEDDFNTVATAIVGADALIVVAPTYFLGPNSCLKRFTDRGIALYPHLEKLWGKPAIGVGIAGIEGKEGYTQLGLQSFLKLLMSDVRQTRMVYGALPGEVFMNDANKKAATELATALFGQTAPRTAPCCPLCRGETFQFLGQDRVRCMLCSNAGTVSMHEGVPSFDIRKSDHDLFLTLEDAVAHREWLVGMKSRFIQNKKKLKTICLDYRKEGEWIKSQT